jgi:WhiB family redox-sensing transcriptional regulator
MPDPLAWQSDALCAQTDPDMFLPEQGGSTRDAKRVCAACPVRRKCLEYALAQEFNPQGIWGGTSVRERKAMRRDAA